MKIFIMMFLWLIAGGMAAQDNNLCKRDAEVLPKWVCTTVSDFSAQKIDVVGSGESLLEAINDALVQVGFAYKADVGKTFVHQDTKEAVALKKEKMQISFGNTIDLRAKIAIYSRKQKGKEESLTTYVSRLMIGDKKDNSYLLFEMYQKESNDNLSSKYQIDLQNIDLSQALREAGIDVVKTYITPKLNLYVWVKVKRETITVYENEE